MLQRASTDVEYPLCVKIQEKIEVAQKRDVEGMGTPEIKYGESMCFVQHVSSGLWLTYAAVDAKSARLGPLKRKVVQIFATEEILMTPISNIRHALCALLSIFLPFESGSV